MLNFIIQLAEPNILENAFSMGLFFVVVGYQFLLFCYFLLIKFRKTRKIYWLYFSLFFLFIGLSRVFFIIYDFTFPFAYELVVANPRLPLTINRWAQFTGWIAVATLVGILSTLLFTKEDDIVQRVLRILFPSIVVVISFLWFILPDHLLIDPDYYMYTDYAIDHGLGQIQLLFGKAVGLFILNYIILSILSFLLPFLFFYLAAKSVGIIQKSSILNGLGFLTYYIGRSLQPVLKWAERSVLTQGLLPPLIILLGLLFLALGNLIMQN
jgi:hypothetical protein